MRTETPTNAHFPETHFSLVERAGSHAGPETDSALETLCRLYWDPLYAFLRRREISPADAQDYVQGFFVRLMEKDFLQQVDYERGRFRTFLRAALWNYVRNERRDGKAERRGGGRPHLSLEELAGVESSLAKLGAGLTPDEVYDRRWAEGLMLEARQALEQSYIKAGKRLEFEELNGWLEKPSAPGDYASLAARRGVTENAIAAAVKRLRGEYRDCLRTRVLATLESPTDGESELKYLIDVLLSEPTVTEP